MDRARSALGIQTQEPTVQTQEVAVQDRGAEEAPSVAEKPSRNFWPAGREMPQEYQRRQILPCPKCRRVLTASGSRAVVTRALAKEMAYLYCKACGNSWKLPVEAA